VALERDSEEHRARRRAFCAFITALSARRLVFIDESFCKTGMRREYGWAPLGQRARGARPFRSWKTISLIGAIRLRQRPRLMTPRGSVSGSVFLRFVKQRLAPWLRRGDVVVMDNLNIHKMLGVRRAIEQVGATPIYLPTYSPELNPIEPLWCDLKRDLRKLALDQQDQLCQALRRLRASLPPRRIAGWFRKSLREAQLK
jgi:transposase